MEHPKKNITLSINWFDEKVLKEALKRMADIYSAEEGYPEIETACFNLIHQIEGRP